MNTIITNNTGFIYNLSTGHADLAGRCQVDAMKVINELEKMPKIAFYFLLAAIILLTLYIFWFERSRNPFIQKYLTTGYVVLPYLFLITATYLYLFTTYNIDAKTFFKTVEPILYIIALAFGIKIIYDYWKKHKGEIKDQEKEE